MIVVGLATYFLVAYPSLISFAGFFVVVPVFLIIGLGFFTIVRKRAANRSDLALRTSRESLPLLHTNCCKQIQEDMKKMKSRR